MKSPWLWLATVASASVVSAQLAITEVMSSRLSVGDFVELTNFGSEAIDLAGYYLIDGDEHRQTLVAKDTPLLLASGQSIIFARTNLVDGAAFISAWADCLPSQTEVRFFPRPGFNSYGDSVNIYDSNKVLVDAVQFGRAGHAASFTYRTDTGHFGIQTEVSEDGCAAAEGASVSTIGRTAGPVPLQIVEQPVNVEVCAGLKAALTVDAIGLPQPRYQWFFNGEMIGGATKKKLTIPNASGETAGIYTVQVSNGLSNIISAPAVVSLPSNPGLPVSVSPPVDTTVVIGSTARFAIGVCAYPPPSYQWYLNGVPLAEETNRVLFIRNTTEEMSGSELCVEAKNPLGVIRECAELYVSNSSPVRITEIHANPQSDCEDHKDFLEISNLSVHDVSLEGYRIGKKWDLAEAVTIEQPVVVRPFESVILVKDSAVGSFFEWWGPEQLPQNLQVIPFSGFSLKKESDDLFLWSDTAEDPAELLDQATFTQPIEGITLDVQILGETHPSSLDERGGIQAVQCGDIGSPGYTVFSPPRFSAIDRKGSQTQLSWHAIQGTTYRVEFSESLNSSWSRLESINASRSFISTTDTTAGRETSRFYRILRESSP